MDVYLPLLTDINDSLKRGIFPNDLAEVIPSFKILIYLTKLTTDQSHISKFFERIV